MVGQTIGKYRVVSRLGRGGMGTVYKAVDETLQREVAIKCLNGDLTESEVLKRFRAEAMTLARLNHPNIAMLFELAEHDGQLLMVMELVQGETFDKVSERLGPLTVPRAVELCTHVLDALSHAHKVGIVHRDLKPANLMLADSGVVKVMDFGLARMQGTEHLTSDGFMIGTPAYMSPEQVLGTEVDGRADLYAMGVVFYRLLTGQLPFKADSGIAMAHKQMYDAPTPVRQLRMELPSVFEDLFTRALAKSPDDRFQSADEMKSALTMVSTMDATDITRTLTSLATLHQSHPPLPVPHLSHPSMPAAPAAPTAPATPAVAAPIQSHSAMPVPITAKPVQRKKTPIAAFVAGVVVLAAIPALIFVWRARSAEPQTVSPAPAPVVAAPAATAASGPAPQPAADPSTASASAPAPSPAPAPPTAVTPPPPSSGAATPAKRATVKTADAALPSAPPVVAAEPAAPAPPAAVPAPVPATPALPPVTFNRLKFLGVQDGKPRDRNAILRLESDALHVLDGDSTLQTAAYGEVIGLYHSHSKEPQWATPNGTAVPVVKVGGKFTIFKGTPDWVTIRTKKGFIPLRVDNDLDLARLIAALEIRTGTRVVQTK